MHPLKSISVKTPSGVTLACVEQGDRQAPAVILVHGYSDSWLSLGPLLQELSPTHRAIAVTLRGHGNSDKPQTGYAIGDLADDLRAVMDHCGVQSAAVVGHSMGSMVAARLALAHPDRVQALVLIGALATLKGNAVEAELRETVTVLSEPVSPDFVRAFQESTLARPVAPAFLDTIVAESLKLPANVWRQALQAMLDDDLTPDLHRLAKPTLIVWGDQDAIADRAGQVALTSAIPLVRLSIVNGAGHAPHWEDPRGIAGAITAFLDTAPRAAA